MTNLFDRTSWSSPVEISDGLASIYDTYISWDDVLDLVEAAMEKYNITAKTRKAPDYSDLKAALDKDGILTVEILNEVMVINAWVILDLVSGTDKPLKIGDIVEVVRRYPRVFDLARQGDEHGINHSFRNQYDSALEIIGKGYLSLSWVLGEQFPANVNWWEISIPFIKEALEKRLSFDKAIAYTSVGMHDVNSVIRAIEEDIAPSLMRELLSSAI